MAIPTHKAWLDATSRNVFRPRSGELKMVDEAIKAYETNKTPAALGKIKLAFEAWKRAKGAGWSMNERNKSGALSQLNTDLLAVQAVRFTPQELQALAHIAEQRKRVIRTLFEGKKVTLKGPKSAKDALQDAVAEVRARGEDAVQSLKSVGKMTPTDAKQILREKLEKMAQEIFQVDTLGAIGDIAGFVIDVIEQCSISVAPVVGHIKDGYDLIVDWAGFAKTMHERNNIAARAYVLDTGVPAAAFNALKQILTTEAKTQAAEASLATSSFALKTGLSFVDGGAISGPVVGAAKALSTVSLKLYALGTEWRATRNANEALRTGALDITLFRTYPLLGCYVLTSATLSDLIPLQSFGQPGWMDYIETLKKRGFDGIHESATGLIESSHWEIAGMPKRPTKGAGLPGIGATAPLSLASDVMGLFG